MMIDSRTRIRGGAAVALVGVAAVAGVSGSLAGTTKPASKPKPVVKTVAVKDDVYAPTTLKIKVGNEVNWVWDKNNYDSHNVTLTKGPKGISNKKYTSVTGTSGILFERAFTTPGTYHFECTIHPESMTMTVVVSK